MFKTLLAVTVAGAIYASAAPAQAGPLLDWLFGRSYTTAYAPGYTAGYAPSYTAGYAPTTVGYAPTTTAYAPGYTAGYSPGYTAYRPAFGLGIFRRPALLPTATVPTATVPTTQTVGYAPVASAGGCNTCSPAPQVTVAYQPRVSYRYSWLKVPVTTYRPVSTVDPTTGCACSQMQPCTTTKWQLGRIPVTTNYPTFKVAAPAATCNTCSPCNSCNACSSCGIGASPTISYSGAPATNGCSSCAGGVGQTVTQLPAGAIPAGAIPTGAIPVGSGVSPSYPATPGPAATTPAADQVPTLSPTEARGIQTGGGVQGSGVSTRTYPTLPIEMPSNTTPRPFAQPISTSPAQAVETTRPRIRPVPDLDLNRLERTEPGVPGLFDPDDRTAANPIRRTAAFVPATWKTNVSQRATAIEVAKPVVSKPVLTKPVVEDDEWDTSGWTSIAN